MEGRLAAEKPPPPTMLLVTQFIVAPGPTVIVRQSTRAPSELFGPPVLDWAVNVPLLTSTSPVNALAAAENVVLPVPTFDRRRLVR